MKWHTFKNFRTNLFFSTKLQLKNWFMVTRCTNFLKSLNFRIAVLTFRQTRLKGTTNIKICLKKGCSIQENEKNTNPLFCSPYIHWKVPWAYESLNPALCSRWRSTGTYMRTMICSSGTPWAWTIWYAWQTSAWCR